MWKHRFEAAFATIALVALMSSCAAPSAGPVVPTQAASANDLAGTWNGRFWIIGGFFYPNEGTIRMQIKENGSYTVTMTPTGAANNIAKRTSWSGTVVENGKLVVFRTSHEPWSGTWSSLARSGDTLYGVTNDPMNETAIGVKLRRASVES